MRIADLSIVGQVLRSVCSSQEEGQEECSVYYIDLLALKQTDQSERRYI